MPPSAVWRGIRTFVGRVRDAIVDAYLRPLTSLFEVAKVVVVRDRAEAMFDPKIRIATPAPGADRGPRANR